MSSSVILSRQSLQPFPWQAFDPFLFCVHHLDHYPAGKADLGPQASLRGRQIGQDFDWSQDWRMYHGDTVPGFPSHPHRGFETITVVRQGMVDHFDSLGAAGRYGNGDVQWMTAGGGVQHSEMFPLLHQDRDNPLDLFQIWLNLPRKSKFTEPFIQMIWAENVARQSWASENGSKAQLTLYGGRLGSLESGPTPPGSWAADPANQVAVALLELEAGTELSLPAAASGADRRLYFYQGDTVTMGGQEVEHRQVIQLDPTREVAISSPRAPARLLLLQGRPIGEPVVSYGPFVMNSPEEIRQAHRDYQQTRFGGWPWERSDPVHPLGKGRFLRHADGRLESQEA